MTKIEKILNKYAARRNTYFPKEFNPWKSEKTNFDGKLFDRWDKFIGKNWYGFSLEWPIPEVWIKIIDEFLDYIREETGGKFFILQWKLKFGSLRAYTDFDAALDKSLVENIRSQIDILERELFDRKLIY